MFFFEKFIWKQKMQLWRLRRKLKISQQRAKKTLDRNPIVILRQYSYQKIPSSTLVPQTCEMWFWQPHWSFLGIKLKIPHSKSERRKKPKIFLRKVFFFEMFQLKQTKQFGQHRRNFHEKRPNFSRSTFKHDTKNTMFSNRYKVFLGTQRMRFWQHGRKNINIWPKNFS